jgi:hypothetical protein
MYSPRLDVGFTCCLAIAPERIVGKQEVIPSSLVCPSSIERLGRRIVRVLLLLGEQHAKVEESTEINHPDVT